MIDVIDNLMRKYKNKGILIDTNLLILFLIGSIDPDFIPTFKRTKKYIKEDFYSILKIISYFNSIVTTPNILTEVNNLSNSLTDKYRFEFYRIFSKAIILLDEHHIISKEMVGKVEFEKFGLTDSIIYYVTSEKYLLLTDDFPLSQYVRSKNGDAINFNHIRMLNW